MRRSWMIIGFLFAAALPATAFAQQEQIRARPRLWYAEIDGNLLGDSPTIPGTDLDANNDLGIEDDRNEWLEVMLSQGGGRTWVSWLKASPDGDVTLTSPESLNGVSYPASTAISGEIEITYYRLTHERFIMAQQVMGFALILSFLSGFDLMEIDFSMTDGVTASKKGTEYYAFNFGFRAEAWVKQWLTIEAHIIAGPKVELEDVLARTMEWQVTINLKLESVSVELGYRWTNFLARESKGGGEHVKFDFDMQGFFFGIGIAI